MMKLLKNYPEITAAISERTDGSMKIFSDGRNDRNRNLFFDTLRIEKDAVFSAEQVHGSLAETVTQKSPTIVFGADALITKQKNIFLTVTVADCIPVFFYEPNEKIIGIAHAGWRGILEGIMNNTLIKISEAGGDPEALFVSIGPGIRECHFEIGEDIIDKFHNFKYQISKRDGKIFVDLKGMIKNQLSSGGVKKENIEDVRICTFCDNNYFSYRRDKPKEVEAMMAVIGIWE